nr:MAG TPA: hypothetical protein [Caudoviricetes sp.]
MRFTISSPKNKKMTAPALPTPKRSAKSQHSNKKYPTI